MIDRRLRATVLLTEAAALGLQLEDLIAAHTTPPPPAPTLAEHVHDYELTELIDAIRTTSNDPDLDLLLVQFHLESGARRQGALQLRLTDIDPRRATVWLREKNNSDREQPLPNIEAPDRFTELVRTYLRDAQAPWMWLGRRASGPR